jgi:hypothetical protein
METLVKELEAFKKARDEYRAHEENVMRLYHEWKEDLSASAIAALKADGFPEYKMNVGVGNLYEDRPYTAEVRISVGNRHSVDFDVEIDHIAKINVSGLFCTMKSAEEAETTLDEITEYYNIAGTVASLLKKGLPNTVAFLKTIKKPEFPKWTGLSIAYINRLIADLEAQVLADGFKVGSKVEIYISGKSKWTRAMWKEAHITGITENSVMVSTNDWNYRVKKSEIKDKLRAL